MTGKIDALIERHKSDAVSRTLTHDQRQIAHATALALSDMKAAADGVLEYLNLHENQKREGDYPVVQIDRLRKLRAALTVASSLRADAKDKP